MSYDRAHTRAYTQDAGQDYIYEAALFHVCLWPYVVWSLRFARTPDGIHPSFGKFLNQIRAFLHALCQRHFAPVISRVLVIFVKHKLIDVDPCDATFNAFSHNVWWELIRSVQHNLHPSANFLVDRL